jgi:hypothetical protein
VALLVLLGIAVDETIDTSGTERSSGNALALLAGPWTCNLAAAEGLDGTSHERSFGGLLPLL